MWFILFCCEFMSLFFFKKVLRATIRCVMRRSFFVFQLILTDLGIFDRAKHQRLFDEYSACIVLRC